MKYLIGVVVVCTLLLVFPYMFLDQGTISWTGYQGPAENVTFVRQYRDTLAKLHVNDIVVFNTNPPHFAKVGQQAKGEFRSLYTLEDSLVVEKINSVWAKKYLENSDLEWKESSRFIHPNINEELEKGDILVAFRNVITNAFYVESIGWYILSPGFFIFFFGIYLFSFIPDRFRIFARVLLVIGLAAIGFYSSNRFSSPIEPPEIRRSFSASAFVLLFLISTLWIYPYRIANKLKDRYGRQAFKFVSICVVFALAYYISYEVTVLVYPELATSTFYSSENALAINVWTGYYYGYAFSFASLVIFGIKNYRRIRKEKNSAIHNQLNTTAQLNSLQARLNPHFLYNTLNSIASLIKTDPEKAEEMTVNVSKFMRHFSNRHSEHLTQVSEEVEMIKEYLEIEKIRFAERLEYVFEVSDEARAQSIPRSLLQPLVENAVKYGYSESSESISIRVVINFDDPNLTISIYDGGKGFDEALDKGYGLSSVYDKLTLLYDDAYDVSFTNHPNKHISISIQTDKLRMDD